MKKNSIFDTAFWVMLTFLTIVMVTILVYVLV